MGYWGYDHYKPYVNVAARKSNAVKHANTLAKKSGRDCSPVHIEGTKIAKTFWGKGWCDHLESYSDYSNRLPRGRTYVRNGSVVDLCIEPGKIHAIVAGSEVYEIDIEINPLAAARWNAIKSKCAGQIASMVELLQGRLSKGVMEIITNRDEGMFPAPREIEMDCSCPDGARMCKHIAAVLYGVGARFDDSPELLFTLRKVDHLELIQTAGDGAALGTGKTTGRKTLDAGDLSDVFGIDLDATVSTESAAPAFPTPKKLKPTSVARAKPIKTKERKTSGDSATPGKNAAVADRRAAPKTRNRKPRSQTSA